MERNGKFSIILAKKRYICPDMSKFKKYNLNPDTLVYEEAREGRVRRFVRLGWKTALSAAVAALYLWIYFGVLGMEPPKTTILKARNASWQSRLAVMNRNLDRCDEALGSLEMRDEEVYRTIFGMNPIPKEVLNSGFGGVNRYNDLENLGRGSLLRDTYIRLDGLVKETYIQSKAYDEVANLSKQAGDMASCLPAIPPISPAKGTYRLSSGFGTREDPVYGGARRHEGMDFATDVGHPVYATGNGVVEMVSFKYFGYGNMVVVNHGFGYKTRYAHLHTINVVEGMKIRRGECLGTVGRTGKTTGPHLHYEVRYKDSPVNPANYMDLDMSPQEFEHMISSVGDSGQAILDPNYRHRN